MIRTVCILLVCTALITGETGKSRQKASKMQVSGSDTLGEDMFEVEKDGDEERKVSFGLFKIVELDDQNNTINATGHRCNFRKMNVTCTKGNMGDFFQDGVDDDGNSTDVKAQRVSRECDLSACNNGTDGNKAKLVLYTDIFENKGYICQPNCTTNANETYQSPVSNGTVKWSLKIENWNFCGGSGACGNKTATQMKIVFKVMGKNKKSGEFKAPKRKNNTAYDSEAKNSTCKAKRINMQSDRSNMTRPDRNKQGGQGGSKKDNGKNNSNDKGGNRSKRSNHQEGGKNKNGTKPDGDKRGVKAGAGDRSGWGRCRNARGTGPGGKPDDQDNFNFDGNDTGSVFRMMGMAVMDNYTLADSSENGFFGPGDHEEKDMKGNGIPGLVYIIVPKFNNTMEYDPTVDIDESGGSGTSTDGDSSASISLTPVLSLILIAVFSSLS